MALENNNPEGDSPEIIQSKVKSTKILQIDSANEFPSLFKNPNLPTQKPVINWASLFAPPVPKTPLSIQSPPLPSISQVPKTPHRIQTPPLSPLSIAITKEISPNRPASEKDNLLFSPTTVGGMSIMYFETTETAVERDATNTPWGSPTAKKDEDASVAKAEDVGNDSITTSPEFMTADAHGSSQKELLPPFEFPAVNANTNAEPEVDLYNASPKLSNSKGKQVEVESQAETDTGELSEAERHDTPSYIPGGLPLWQVVQNDPHRVLHAIKKMMNGIVIMKEQLRAPPEEIEALKASHRDGLRTLEILTERERAARLVVERIEAAERQARLEMEEKCAASAREMERSKLSTKFNPSAKPFNPSPSTLTQPEVMNAAGSSSFALPPTRQNPSPLKYSVLHEPGFMVEQSRAPPAPPGPYKFHPLLNRSNTWSTRRAAVGPVVPVNPYSHFNAYNQAPMAPVFSHQIQAPLPMLASQLSLDTFKNLEIDPRKEATYQSPQPPTPMIQSQLNLSMGDMPHFRMPVPGKTVYKSVSTSPIKDTSTNTSPGGENSNLNQPYYATQLLQPKPFKEKLLIPPTNNADEIQKAVLSLPKSHRHICPSSLSSPDYRCPVSTCLLQHICPDFTSENGCSFRPPPLSDWPWNYPPRNPPTNRTQQCAYVHIPGTCQHSLSYFRASGPSPEAQAQGTFNGPAGVDPATESHYCPLPNCPSTHFHAWGCAKDWKTGFAINGTTPLSTTPAYTQSFHPYQLASEVSNEWRWRLALEGLRVAHERGEYGCRGNMMPVNSVFPEGHKGADSRNWAHGAASGKWKAKGGRSKAGSPRSA